MMVIMKDRNNTRIQNNSLASYTSDIHCDMSKNLQLDSINLVIGGVKLVLIYDKKEDRDEDINRLDQMTGARGG